MVSSHLLSFPSMDSRPRSAVWLPLWMLLAVSSQLVSGQKVSAQEVSSQEVSSQKVGVAVIAGRPTHAVVEARLANWDHDAEPDGWKARIVLLDKNSCPVALPAHASFELIPRMPSLDRTRYIDVPVKPMRWWKRLEFDESGVAVVQLPKRAGDPVPTFASRQRETRFGRRPYLDNRVGRGVFDELGSEGESLRPYWAVLKIRVSVPTVGVLEAVSPVAFAEPLLVDSGWPYR